MDVFILAEWHDDPKKPPFEIQGVFSSAERARLACRGGKYEIVCMALDIDQTDVTEFVTQMIGHKQCHP